MINIDKGVPIPIAHKKNREYPFDYMDIGDSFFMNNRSSAFHALMNRHNVGGKKFISRAVEGGFRVWRVK